MAETNIPNFNFNKKNVGGEDPVLIAQRFLNIFRQLHIFDEKRHEEFKSQILALPPEVRNSFGSLPGGQALQEYTNNLIQQQGGDIGLDVSASQPQGNILSAALSEAKESPSAPKEKSTTQTVVQNVSGKVFADESFAQVLAQAFAKALQFSDANKKGDIQELINAIKESKTVSEDVSQAPQESRIIADEAFAQVLAKSFAKALQFSDANKKEDIKALIEAIKESKSTAGNETKLDADFASTLSQSFMQALEQLNTNRKGELEELVKAIKEIKINVPNLPVVSHADQTDVKSVVPSIGDEDHFAKILAQSFASALEIVNTGHKEELKELVQAIRESAPLQSEASSGAFPEKIQVVADENFAQTISLGVSNALETFAHLKNAEMQELIDAINKRPQYVASGETSAPVFAPSGEIKIVPDDKFAQTITQSFSDVLKLSEEKRQAEFEKIINLVQQQSSFVPSAEHGPLVSTPTPVFGGNLSQEIGKILSEAISSSKAETIELTKAIRESQGELTKVLSQNFHGGEQASSQDDQKIVSLVDEIVNRVIQAQSGFLKEISLSQTQEISDLISASLQKSQELSSQTIINTIKAFQEENLKLIRNLPPITLNAANTMSDISLNRADKSFSPQTSSENSFAKFKAEAEKTALLDMQSSPFSSENNSADVLDNETSLDTKVEAPQSYLDTSLFEDDHSDSNEPEALSDFLNEDNEEIEESVNKTAKNNLFDDHSGEKFSVRDRFNKYIQAEFERPLLEEETSSSEDWGFTPTPEPSHSKEEIHDIDASGEVSSSEDDANQDEDWVWEYEEEPQDETSLEEENLSSDNEEDWVWEYEEEPDGSESLAREEAQDNASDDEGIEGQDWEWDYEEEDGDEENIDDENSREVSNLQLSDENTLPNADEQVSADDEWVWAYDDTYGIQHLYGKDVDTYLPAQLNSFIFMDENPKNEQSNFAGNADNR